MKLGVVVFLVLALFAVSSGQKVKFSGTVYDYNGAVVASATINGRSEKGQLTSGKSNDDGKFEIELQPGLYALEVSANGFLTVQYEEYLIVNSPVGMRMDFVLFGARWHEPCGVGGADCLPSRLLIRNYKIKYSPSLKQIREDFSDLIKNTKRQ